MVHLQLLPPSPCEHVPHPCRSAAPAAAPSEPKKNSNFTNRVIFGIILGLSAALIVGFGRIPFLAVAAWIAYQATQEYFGFITSSGMTKGMAPPPRMVRALTTALCVGMVLLAHFSGARSGTQLAVAAFGLLVLEVVTIKKPKFAQLASSLFGLFYCGGYMGVHGAARGWGPEARAVCQVGGQALLWGKGARSITALWQAPGGPCFANRCAHAQRRNHRSVWARLLAWVGD